MGKHYGYGATPFSTSFEEFALNGMKRRSPEHPFLTGILLVAGLLGPTSAQAQIDYTRDVQPILDLHCVSCHGGTSDVDLDTYERVMTSIGEQYQRTLVTPGDPADSPLYDKLLSTPKFGDRMPNANGLSAQKIETIRQWIAEGALQEASATARASHDGSAHSALSMTIYPNPIGIAPHASVVVHRSEIAPAELALRVLDLMGRTIYHAVLPTSAANTTVALPSSTWAEGAYLVQVSLRGLGEGQAQTRTALLIR